MADYDCVMLDLDGVVYVGAQAVEGVPSVLERVRKRGVTLAFVTNNASRSPEAVAGHLAELGIPAAGADVITSAQAAATEIARQVPTGSRVLVIGGEALAEEVRGKGMVPVRSATQSPKAVVQGFHADIGWRDLAECAYAVSTGLPWVASNLDLTLPTERGTAPGNGSLVAAVSAAAGRGPSAVAGKPYRPLFDEAVERTGCQHPLMVGDRLDTDIQGANRCGAESLLVMTGVTSVGAVCTAPPEQRPTFVGWTTRALEQVHQVPAGTRHGANLGGWHAYVDEDGQLTADGAGESRDDLLRALVTAAWEWADTNPGADLRLDRLDASAIRG
ncbi:MAG: HAD-IIA family hydrolase [Nocardioidaceae bacterium]